MLSQFIVFEGNKFLRNTHSDLSLPSVRLKSSLYLFIIYETIKGELNRRLAYDCRCDERLNGKSEDPGSTHSVMGTCVSLR